MALILKGVGFVEGSLSLKASQFSVLATDTAVLSLVCEISVCYAALLCLSVKLRDVTQLFVKHQFAGCCDPGSNHSCL